MRTVYLRAALALGAVTSASACSTSPQHAASDSPSAVAAQAQAHTPGNLARDRSVLHETLEGPHHVSRFNRSHAIRRGRGAGHAAGDVPQITNQGGPVLTAPKVVPIIFPGSSFDAQMRDFIQKLQGSSYWHDVTAEYGVGPITTLPVYEPTDPPPAPDAGSIDAWIGALAASPPPGVPAPDDNTIYAIVLPCIISGGYHEWHTLPSGQNVLYTVTSSCVRPLLGLVGLDRITATLSHEIVEAATDPTATTYQGVNWVMSGWASAAEGVPAGETADMCEFQPNAFYVNPDLGYMVSRIWSNQAAAGGHDPCQPLLPGSGPYFTADAILSEGTRVEQGVYARGVSIPPGSQATIPVRLRADGPMDAWQLSAQEVVNHHLPPDVYNELSFSWDQASGRAGDTRYLTITRSAPPPGASPVFLRVAINSTSGSVTNTSWLVVGVE